MEWRCTASYTLPNSPQELDMALTEMFQQQYGTKVKPALCDTLLVALEE